MSNSPTEGQFLLYVPGQCAETNEKKRRKLGDVGHSLVISTVRGTQCPKSRPVANAIVRDSRHGNTSLDTHTTSSSSNEVRPLGLDPGGRPCAVAAADGLDLEVAAAVQTQVARTAGVRLDLASAPV